MPVLKSAKGHLPENWEVADKPCTRCQGRICFTGRISISSTKPRGGGAKAYTNARGTWLPAAVWHAILSELYTLNLVKDAERVAVPTLSISGKKDELFDAGHGLDLQKAIVGSRLIVREGRGHNPHWESPSVVAAYIRDFLDTLHT